MGSPDRPINLRKTLESNFLAHRKDVHDYAGGHLNPDKLLKLEAKDTHVSWKSAQPRKKEEQCQLIAQTRKQADKMLAEKIRQMQNTLVDFSVGTAASVSEPRPPSRKGKGAIPPARRTTIDFSNTMPEYSETDLEERVLAGITKLLDNQDRLGAIPSKLPGRTGFQSSASSGKRLPSGTYKFHKVLTEEVKLPELMLPCVQEDVRVPASMKDPFQTPKQRVTRMTDKNFMTMHLAGITQKDRFSKILDFDRNVLHRYETMEKNVRDGHKAAEHLEHKLVVRLLEMKEHTQQPYSVNFERLQVYDEVWRDLCVDSSTFGLLLLEIKHQYDSRLSSLLDIIKSTSHSEILTCLHATEGLTEFTEADVENRKCVVDQLEEEGRQALLKNYELHQDIQKERVITEEKKKQKEKEEKENRLMLPLKYFGKKKVGEKEQSSKKEVNSKKHLQVLRVKIWETVEEINKVRRDLKENYTPKTLHKNMQQAVQDTEGEMQKLLQQRQYVSKNITIHLESLRYDLGRFDKMTTEESDNFLSILGTS